MSPPVNIDLESLGFDRGAHLIVDRALRALPPGGRLRVTGSDPALAVHLAAWCRSRGHGLEPGGDGPVVVRGRADDERWADATRSPTAPAAHADPAWGLAARGALLETGGPEPRFDLDEQSGVWADSA